MQSVLNKLSAFRGLCKIFCEMDFKQEIFALSAPLREIKKVIKHKTSSISILEVIIYALGGT
jgi:hypothetical protein